MDNICVLISIFVGFLFFFAGAIFYFTRKKKKNDSSQKENQLAKEAKNLGEGFN